MRAVLDTSAYIRYGAAHEETICALEAADQIFIPFAVYAELLSGFRKGTRFQANLSKLEQIIESLEIQWISAERNVADVYSEIYDALRRAGRPVPTNDLWIAACCLSVSGVLLTTDRHFEQMPHLQLRLLS